MTDFEQLNYPAEQLSQASLEKLAGAALQAVQKNGWTLGGAESLTGGLVSATIVDIPGVSEFYHGCLVTYSYAQKSALLGVDGDYLERYGAVNTLVAQAMATGARERLGVDVAFATTGLAGPDDWNGIRAGSFLVALALPTQVLSRACYYRGNRRQVRLAATRAALELLEQIGQQLLPN